ncbi:hypothetical protein [Amycolatopsis balhimycina]|uniref:hypothetical protein n=1 Tax=Amycolatopsis balhimycina TaxID=208443 RepID=UPI000F773BF0|nr:hypothetical protein [Amycolatopsis balhimycina]
MSDKFRTIIDLLDAFFGASWTPESVSRLTADELDALAVDVDDFYAGYQPSVAKPELLRCFRRRALMGQDFSIPPKMRTGCRSGKR